MNKKTSTLKHIHKYFIFKYFIYRIEVALLKSKPQISQESRNRQVQDLLKADQFRVTNLLIRNFAPWCQILILAR